MLNHEFAFVKLLNKWSQKNRLFKHRILKNFLFGNADAEVSRQIWRLIDRNMPVSEKEGSRKYVIRFDNSFLLRGFIKSIGEKGFHDKFLDYCSGVEFIKVVWLWEGLMELMITFLDPKSFLNLDLFGGGPARA